MTKRIKSCICGEMEIILTTKRKDEEEGKKEVQDVYTTKGRRTVKGNTENSDEERGKEKGGEKRNEAED